MNFNVIVAVDSNNGIGIDNSIPWYEPDDLKHFSKITRGDNNNAIVMGNNTWNSLPKKPLKNRDNLILSRKDHTNGDGFAYFKDIESIIEYCKEKNYDVIWVIGGGEIYKLFLEKNMIDNIYLSRLNKEYECDVFFPNIPDKLRLTKKEKINNNVELEIYSS